MNAAADVFLERWRALDPALRLAEIYDRSGRLAPTLGLHFELSETVYRLSERRIAEGKLAWWMDEAQALRFGQPRHPLTRTLQELGLGTAAASLISATGRSFDAPTPVDRVALEPARKPLLDALGALLEGAAKRNDLAALDDVFRLASVGLGGADLCSPLALADWARFGHSRQTLVDQPAAARKLRQELARLWLPEDCGNGALSVYVGLWRSALQQSGGSPRPGVALGWRAWRLARASVPR
jgi:hypothetical protein